MTFGGGNLPFSRGRQCDKAVTWGRQGRQRRQYEEVVIHHVSSILVVKLSYSTSRLVKIDKCVPKFVIFLTIANTTLVWFSAHLWPASSWFVI